MKKTQNICMVIDAWDPVVGGGQTHVMELSKRFVEDYSCKVHLVTRDLSGGRHKHKIEELYDGNFVVHRIGVKASFSNIFARVWWCLRAGFYIRKLHMKEHFDLIHAHALLSSYPARLARWLCGLPVIYTVHGTSLFYKKSGFKAWIEKDLLTKIEYDCVISVAANFLKLKNVNKNVCVVPNGIDLAKFDKVPAPEHDHEKFRILYVGRFDTIKGVDVLVRAISELADEGFKKELEVRLVGYGYEIKKLKKLVSKLHLTRVVKFVGMKKEDELIEEYKLADVFVLPSYSEGQSLTLMEACACGLPILATDVGDNSKLVKEDVNGYLVPTGNSHEIAEYLKRFISHPHLQNMGVSSRAILEGSEMTWDNAAARTYDIYGSVFMELKWVPASAKLKDILKDSRMPHFVFHNMARRARMTKFAARNVRISEPVLCSVTVDFERNNGSEDKITSLQPSIETCQRFVSNFKDFAAQQEFKSTLFVQGNLVPHLVPELHTMEDAGHELGVHGMYHGLWGGAKWFLDDRPLTKAEKMEFLSAAMKNFEEAGLKKPVSFRAPNLVANDETYDVLAEYGITYDSSYSSFAGGSPLPYEINGVKGVPVSFDPTPHFDSAGLIFPVVKYFMMTTYHFLRMSDEEIEEILRMIFLVQRKAKVKPHLVLLMHSWEYEASEVFKFCGGDNYTKLAKRLYFLQEKFGLNFKTFAELTEAVCT
ncbi:hypothetical protein COT83_05730 [Candidatus Peregrinibacteria bacterium CG10_big_fil_rev_8_21_14_0_10_44_7]|nr:MAG: hypothetical protein COT83_05730 [Candidatus Peregrinibacteria bacterium CG10_big_fil_rev_8_21_14_0_10_44_7]